ncbi:transglutaminase-like domain-containing protein [Barnesiella sp. WM24]|uniref:transglutaminase-like domain-containing protein n=1 Tax=Barnesiella sp. WM24 TaxID=2558278 RepID=UPI0010727E5B|nr:transglutaminase-like domain-containing protein [Barnesiella sp. WM24]
MKYYTCCIIFSLISVASVSCSRDTCHADMEEVLSLSGKNRDELEKVLDYYNGSQDDSLKLRAAKYLIKNMPGKYSLVYDVPWENHSAALYRYFDCENKESLFSEYGIPEPEKRYDLECISADYLINNIELAFEAWESHPWGKTIDFASFCEEILPYRIGNEPLEDWRGKVLASYREIDNRLRADSCMTAGQACAIVNRLLPEYSWVTYPVPPMNYSMLTATPRGTCDEMCALAMFTMRALGIPVVMDFTPSWPNRTSGHAWNSVNIGDGMYVSFMGTEYNPGEEHLGTRLRKCKVFRRTFARQDIDTVEIPSILNDPYIIDVSDKYRDTDNTATVRIDFPQDEKALYLYTFEKPFPEIIDRGIVNGSFATFEHVGGEIMYLPVYIDGGEILPASFPFMINRGKTVSFDGDLENKVKVEIDNLGLNQSMLFRMQEGSFEASNDSVFGRKVVLHEIEDIPGDSTYTEIPIASKAAYKYVRYMSPKGSSCNVAEIEFYNADGGQLTGNVIGTAGSWYSSGMTKEKVFDGDIYTYFDAPFGFQDYSWVGLKFDVPQVIGSIRYFPRIEDNRLVNDHRYEVFYWTGDDWQVILNQKPVNGKIVADLPEKGIYYIRDAKNNKESYQYFIIDNSRQKWL